MIVLDTNIALVAISGRRHPAAAPARQWLASRSPHELFVTTITLAEVAAGVETLPDGARKELLRESAASFFAAMEPNLLDFTTAAATEYARVISRRKRLGRPISVLDAQIAAIALAAGASLATRNSRDFEGTGLRTTDPYA
ncbi:MAG: PIN domain-containing protein [Bifidobacteriaceae bacterium]|jgi:predicted nucleic acid-binding protein|nr:PIN domain-containing protein [Bifidobacteriaceae bacterium]